MSEISKVLDIARDEIGYIEKASNSMLDSKIANAGKNNYTKYARDMDALNVYNTKKQGYAWCNIFIDWCFYKALGQKRAKELLLNWSAGCTEDWNTFKRNGQIVTSPKAGDLVFLGDTSHIGIIEKIVGTTIYTIEGNTSNDAVLVTNGGQVARKSYSVNSQYIYGYARPAYKEETNNSSDTSNNISNYSYRDFVGNVQRAIGAKVDYIAGPITLSKTPTISRYKNRSHAVVKPLQKYLYALGYTEVGNADGIAGPKFEAGAKHFQRDHGCVQDGEFTAKCKSWKKILKLA